MSTLTCPLCEESATENYCQIPSKSGDRDFMLCSGCDLMFLNPSQRPSQAVERKHYDLHNNVITDDQYCDFLRRLINPLLAKLKSSSPLQKLKGLDYGSGPSPVLAELLTRAGHHMSIFDPYFATDQRVLHVQYDFVTCTEVVEHFYEPSMAFLQIDELVKPGGIFGLMTGMLPDWSGFSKWHYNRDITHVVFYSRKTINWIGDRFGWTPEFFETGVVLFEKKNDLLL